MRERPVPNSVLLLGLAAFLLSSGAEGAVQKTTRMRYLMGTLCEIQAYGQGAPSAITAAFEEIDRIERWMSGFLPDSEVSRLNREASLRPFRVSRELWSLLLKSLDYFRRTGGAFDPTAGSPGSPGFRAVALDRIERTVYFRAPGLRLNFGGIGKGYALDQAAHALQKAGIQAALLNFGGQVLALGMPPHRKGWKVEVAGPSGGSKTLTLLVQDASVSTSGNAQRPGHILDPRTGASMPRPGRAAVLRPLGKYVGAHVPRPGSVTVVAPSATEADALSTAFFVHGVHPDTNLPLEVCVLRWTNESKETPKFFGNCRKYRPRQLAPKRRNLARSNP